MFEKYYMAAIGSVIGFGNRSIARLVKYFGSAKVAWFADEIDIWNSGVRKNALEFFIQWRKKHLDAPEKLISYCDKEKINLCCISDEDYPLLLKEIDSPPMFFYYRGQLAPFAQRIAIVGSRKNTPLGQQAALELGEQIAAAGFTVVSGAAKGIDIFAHSGALKTGRTVAVLGCGINCKVSFEREKFLAQIAENGVVLSEFYPPLVPTAGTLAARNRIVAGLCKGIIVVEAALKSGSLITSNYAANYRRDIFAVSNNSEGCIKLVREGAIPIKNALDVFNRYGKLKS